MYGCLLLAIFVFSCRRLCILVGSHSIGSFRVFRLLVLLGILRGLVWCRSSRVLFLCVLEARLRVVRRIEEVGELHFHLVFLSKELL